ncbi:hypothetical protein GCM10009776_26530 [Microbacterium deminutum]|uniref:Uncharacterized protein n=1 Tax=Microbacterium deminutum TaxID=344164 RepID=A0ABP5CGN8_9MICO
MFGVCTLVVEVQPGHFFIRVTTAESSSRSAHHIIARASHRVVSPEDAIRLATEFLESFDVPPEALGGADP